MSFTDKEYFEVMEKNEIVKEAFENIKQICIDLAVKKKNSYFLNLSAQSIMLFNTFGYFPFAVKSSRKLNKISSFNQVNVIVLGTDFRLTFNN